MDIDLVFADPLILKFWIHLRIALTLPFHPIVVNSTNQAQRAKTS